MPLDDRIRIAHMIEAAESVARFIAGRSRDDLDRDEMLRFAVVRAIEVIGEAASQITPQTRATIPQVPWAGIIGMRNRLIHAYADINLTLVWKTATEEVPALLPLLRALQEADSGETERGNHAS
jgi:uncharacterized protein with HEPN domain